MAVAAAAAAVLTWHMMFVAYYMYCSGADLPVSYLNLIEMRVLAL